MEGHANPPLEAIVTHTPVAMAVFDTTMRYIAVSEGWLSDYGLDRSPIGLRHYDVFPEISEAWKAVHRRCLAGATESSEGDPFPRADGRVQWVKWKACPWRDSGGIVGGIILTTEDITARKEVEAEAARLAWVVEHANDAIIAKTLDSIVTSWNPGATRLLGYSSEEMIGQSIARVIPAERLAEEDLLLVKLRAGEVVEHFETQCVAKDGSVVDVSLSISPIRDERGTIVGASKILRDVTAQNRARRELASTTAILATINESSPDGILVVDQTGRILSFNRRFAEIFDIPAELLAAGNHEALLARARLRLLDTEAFDRRTRYLYDHPNESGHDELVLRDDRVIERLTSPFKSSDGERLGRIWFFRDITQRRKSQEALRASEERFRLLVEEAPDAIVLYDVDQGRNIAVNKAAERLYGVSRDEILKQGPLRFYAPEQPDGRPGTESFAEHIERALAGEEVTYERRIRRPSGEERLCRATVVHLPSHVHLVRASLVDITEQDRARRELAATAAILAAEHESSPDGILVIDQSSRILSVNRRLAEIFDIPHESLAISDDKALRARAAQLVTDPETFNRRMLYLLDHPDESAHDELIFKRGHVIDRLTAPCKTPDGEYVGRILFFRDITERRRAEEALRASEERFRTLFEEAPDAIIIIDSDPFRTVAVNKAAERLVGLSRDEILRRQPLSFYSPEQPDSRPAAVSVAEHIERAMAGEEVTFERRVRRPSGEDRLCRVTLIRLPSSVSLFRASLVDITEQQATEAKLSEAMLGTVRRQEEERQRIARELHDTLGQYLAGMTMKLDAMGGSAPDVSPLKSGITELKGLTATVGSEMRRLAWELRPAALDDLGLEPAIERLAEEWTRRSGLVFDLDCALKGRRLPTDVETALYRVLQEGVTNIVKHASASKVGVILKMTSDSVVMILEDDGKGFDPETLTCGSNRRFGLLGMRERLALIGGALEIEAAPGAGTTLIIRAPLGDTVTSS